MLNTGNKLDCGPADEIVSYIYGEGDQRWRTRFEEHLSNCTSCTDEFACIADARFSVFEWHKEEFVPLLTPAIVIPYVAAQLSSPVDTSFFAGLRSIFTIPRLATGLAAVLVTAGLGLFGSNYMGDTQMAVVGPEQNTVRPPAPTAAATLTDEERSAASDEAERKIDTPRKQPETKTRRGRTNAQDRDIGKPLTANIKRSADRDANPNSAQRRKAPVLNNFDESDDRSLRLTDLFDDGGSGR
ncbi:MAG TPA: hypothetical protein VNA17_02050 [Pyrinomonadaceae bacterium]|nr:hypothetical protein [Pyrinomonadaceae bacterium]